MLDLEKLLRVPKVDPDYSFSLSPDGRLSSAFKKSSVSMLTPIAWTVCSPRFPYCGPM